MNKIYAMILIHKMKKVSLALGILFTLAVFSGNTQQTIAIALTKMNVLYRGVDNPATILVSGANQQDIKATIDNGMIKKDNQNYNINPTRLGKAIVTVYVKDKVVGMEEFRVKDLPSPVAKVGNHSSGIVEKAWLATMSGITADCEGSNFDYRFTVISFSVTAIIEGKEITKTSTSNKFTEEQINLIKNVASNGKVRIEDIRILGPEGSPREPLPGIMFTLK
jgi:GldM C-terminal domain